MGTRLGRREVLLRRLPLAGLALLVGAQPRTPDASIAELMAADRAASVVARREGFVAGLTGAMAAAVTMPAPGRLVAGLDSVRAELLRDTLAARATAEWAPIGGGISADGRHGFTYGFIDVTRADGRAAPGKYLAYWVRGDRGWRVIAYRRVARADGPVDHSRRPAVLPAAIVAPATDPDDLERHRASLLFAERAFARESQELGLQAGFTTFGSPAAINLGGSANAGFTFGNVAIAAHVADDVPAGTSPVNWWPERAVVASSGDLGITFGYITPNAATPGGPKPRFAFFTIWHRASPNAPWRYVAE